MAKKRIKENPDLVKDTDSGAVINTNSNAFAKRRMQMLDQRNKEERFEQMEKDIAEIKKLIKKLGSK